MTADESIFLADDTLGLAAGFVAPTKSTHVGVVDEGAVPPALPRLFLDWAVAQRLQEEGQRSVREDREVAGILLGTCDSEAQQIRVSHIAVARDEDSSPVHFKFTYSVWDDLIDQMEEMSQRAGEPLLLLGWYHTHPNMAVFLSRYDLRTHRDFHRPYQFALVLAPRVGTAETSVGFFVNRGDPPPLLPAVRIFGADDASLIARALPWRFQVQEAEGIEEGESTAADPGGSKAPPPLVTFQIGVARGEDPGWLLLSEDAAEGPLLPILEGMAAAVVEHGADRMGVLLGAQDKDGRTTVTRVRFLGSVGHEPGREREELLTALRFIAEAFPPTAACRIVGVVRVVAPQRLREGERFQVLEQGPDVVAALRELGKGAEVGGAQVALVLYPGVDEELLYVQAFSGLDGPDPEVRASFQGVAAAELRANERYEPVVDPFFDVERAPSLRPPWVGPSEVPTAAELGPGRPAGTEAPAVENQPPAPVAPPSEPALRTSAPRKRRSASSIGALVAVILLLVAVLFALLPSSRTPNVVATDGPEATPAPTPLPAEPGAPYDGVIFRCRGREGALPGDQPCDVFRNKRAAAELLRLRTTEAYTSLTTVPPELWWRVEGRAPVQVSRTRDGESLVFRLPIDGEGWDELWSGESPVVGELVVVPRGEPIDGGGELAALRQRWAAVLVPPPPAPAPTPEVTSSPTPAEPPPTKGPAWTWSTSGTKAKARWDLEKRAFVDVPSVIPVVEKAGDWSFTVKSKRGSETLGQSRGAPPPLARDGSVPVARALTEILRATKAEAALARISKEAGAAGTGAEVQAVIRPPGGPDLALSVTLEGQLAAPRVRHRVCMVIMDDDGLSVPGQVSVAGGEWFRTWEVQAGQNDCMDGGRSGRWREIEIDATAPELKFQQLSDLPSMATWRGRDQRVSLRAWAGAEGGARCLVIVARVDAAGVQKQSATVTPVARYIDGSCR